jgi:hypothetical protein
MPVLLFEKRRAYRAGTYSNPKWPILNRVTRHIPLAI